MHILQDAAKYVKNMNSVSKTNIILLINSSMTIFEMFRNIVNAETIKLNYISEIFHKWSHILRDFIDMVEYFLQFYLDLHVYLNVHII